MVAVPRLMSKEAIMPSHTVRYISYNMLFLLEKLQRDVIIEMTAIE